MSGANRGSGDQCTLGWSNRTTFGSSGCGANQFGGTSAVFVSADGLTDVVADSGQHRIAVWTRTSADATDWTNQTTFGTYGSGLGELNMPADVFVSTDGLTAFVADQGFQDGENHRISVWTRSSTDGMGWTNQTTFGSDGRGASEFAGPTGVAVSADGRTAFVADTDNFRIAVWTRSSATSKDWSPRAGFGGGQGSGPNQLRFAKGVTVTADGKTALVADSENSRVSVWTLS